MYQVQEIIRYMEDYPNFLHRPPTAEQLYAEGKPDIEVGTLIEGDGLRFGLKLKGSIPHLLAAGASNNSILVLELEVL